MKHPFLFFFALFTLSACATVEYAPSSQLVSSKRVTEKTYEIGVPISTYVGDSMIRVRDFKQDIYSGAQVKVLKSFSMHGFLFNRDFVEGQTFPYGGKTKLGQQAMDFFWVDEMRGILYDQYGEVQEKILSDSGSGTTVFVAYTYENNGGQGAVGREPVQKITNTPDGQNFEIIYSGVSGDSIRLQYREYTDGNMAREAFFQELTYPRDAKSIRFRDLVLNVKAAEADHISFTVVEGTE
jgi:hypothetical protein